MEQLRIGMIGCGEIAVKTAAAIAESAYARHVMVMDTRAELAQDLGERYGVPWTDRVEVLLANPAVDAVYIAVPHYLHAPLAIQAAEAGKQILVEKPIALSLADAEAMIAAARANGVWLSVNFHAQVDPLCQAARNLVAQGAIGAVIGTRIVFRGDKPASYWTSGYSGRVATDWRVQKATAGGGVLIMNIIHDLNTMRFITGLRWCVSPPSTAPTTRRSRSRISSPPPTATTTGRSARSRPARPSAGETPCTTSTAFTAPPGNSPQRADACLLHCRHGGDPGRGVVRAAAGPAHRRRAATGDGRWVRSSAGPR